MNNLGEGDDGNYGELINIKMYLNIDDKKNNLGDNDLFMLLFKKGA